MNEAIYDLIILGAGCAGLSAGIYAGRAKLKTLILDKKEASGQILNTSEVVNYPGILSTSGPQFIETLKTQANNFNCELCYDTIESVQLNDTIKVLQSKTNTYKALSLIIATGALPRKLHFKGEEEFTGRGIAYCATCDGEFFSGLDIFVVGGGYAACEEAMYLTRFGRTVTMIVREEDFTCAKSIADKTKAHPNIKIHFNSEVVEVSGDDYVRTLTYIHHPTNEKITYRTKDNETFGLFIFAGYLPATSLFKAQLDLDEYGYLLTNEQLETNIPGVYAAGDLRPKALRQIVTAVSDGAIASTNCEHYLAKFKEQHPEFNTIKAKENKPSTKLIQGDLTKQLEEVFKKFDQDVILQLYLNQTETANKLEEMMDDLAALTSKIKVEKYPADDLDTAMVKFKDYPIRFHGIPGGHEFNTFILTMYAISTHHINLDQTQKDAIKRIDTPVKLEIGVTLSCHFCPDIVSHVQKICLLNPLIEVDVYDIALNETFKKKHRILSVPVIIFNDKDLLFGAQSIDTIIEKIKTSS